MHPFRLHIRLIAAVLLLSYVVCHVGEGTLATMHSVSHELDAVWDYYVGGGHVHGHTHSHAHGHSHGHDAPHQHSFSGLRQRAQLATSSGHDHPLLSALASAQEQPENSGTPADDQDLRYEKTKKASEKYESPARLRWDEAIYASALPRVKPADQRCPTPPTLGTVVPPPEV